MTATLPAVLADYFAAADRGDVDALVDCFADEAVVCDEDREWHGPTGVRVWRESVATIYDYTVDVRGIDLLGEVDGIERDNVYVHLEGNFPGGTVDLTNEFGLRDGRIASLRIVPTKG